MIYTHKLGEIAGNSIFILCYFLLCLDRGYLLLKEL